MDAFNHSLSRNYAFDAHLKSVPGEELIIVFSQSKQFNRACFLVLPLFFFKMKGIMDILISLSNLLL